MHTSYPSQSRIPRSEGYALLKQDIQERVHVAPISTIRSLSPWLAISSICLLMSLARSCLILTGDAASIEWISNPDPPQPLHTPTLWAKKCVLWDQDYIAMTPPFRKYETTDRWKGGQQRKDGASSVWTCQHRHVPRVATHSTRPNTPMPLCRSSPQLVVLPTDHTSHPILACQIPRQATKCVNLIVGKKTGKPRRRSTCTREVEDPVLLCFKPILGNRYGPGFPREPCLFVY